MQSKSPHLVLALKVNDNVFQWEASFLTQASQHVFDWLAITSWCQGGTAIGQEDTAVSPLQSYTTPTSTALRGAGTRAAILHQIEKHEKGPEIENIVPITHLPLNKDLPPQRLVSLGVCLQS